MKKVTVAAAILMAGLMMSCGGKQAPKEEAVSTPTEQTEIIDTEHNAKNSLDYIGTYKGILPAASAEGIDVTIVLADSTFTKTSSFVGKKDKPTEEKGNYTWDKSGSIITLEGVDLPNQYFVAENYIIQLDTEGNRITGDAADLQNLKKVME